MEDTSKAPNKGKRRAEDEDEDENEDEEEEEDDAVVEEAESLGTAGPPSGKKAKRDTTGDKAGGRGKLTLQQRYDIVKQLKSGRTKASLAREYSVSSAAVVRIGRASDAIIQAIETGMQPGNTRRMRNLDTKMAALDKAILDYVALCRRAFVKTRIRLTYRMICNKARRVARALGITVQAIETDENRRVTSKRVEWAPNTGWFDRMIKRLGIKLQGDAGDVDAAAAAGAMEDLRKSLEPWDVDCIFHMDEAGLFFSQLPPYSLLTREEASRDEEAERRRRNSATTNDNGNDNNNDNNNTTTNNTNTNTTTNNNAIITITNGSNDDGNGGDAQEALPRSKRRDRVTLIVCANASGTCKVPVTAVGKTERPEPFHIIGPSPIPYLTQPNAWVDPQVCQRWFDTVFLPTVKTFTTRPVVLLWDDCPQHVLKSPVDPQVTIRTFPSLLSPLACPRPSDAGVMPALKVGYKHELVARLAGVIEDWDILSRMGAHAPGGPRCRGLSEGHPPHLLDMADMLRGVWDRLGADVIMSAFLKAGCLPQDNQEKLKRMLASHRASQLVSQLARNNQGAAAAAQQADGTAGATAGSVPNVPTASQSNPLPSLLDPRRLITGGGGGLARPEAVPALMPPPPRANGHPTTAATHAAVLASMRTGGPLVWGHSDPCNDPLAASGAPGVYGGGRLPGAIQRVTLSLLDGGAAGVVGGGAAGNGRICDVVAVVGDGHGPAGEGAGQERDVVEEGVARIVAAMAHMALPHGLSSPPLGPGRRGGGHAPPPQGVRLPELFLDNLCVRTDENGTVHVGDVPAGRLAACVRAWLGLEDDLEERMTILEEVVEELEAREAAGGTMVTADSSSGGSGCQASAADAAGAMGVDERDPAGVAGLALSRGALCDWPRVKELMGIVAEFFEYHGYARGRVQMGRLLNACMEDRRERWQAGDAL